MDDAKRSVRYFYPSETIPDSGIYRVYHANHRVSHEVTLLSGETFPTCSKCHNAVYFELLRRVQPPKERGQFRIRLFQIPHPKDEDPKAA